jgi:transcriptional regulator with XRE-family HTH domain
VSELAAFLRSRREHLTPADVGLRDSGRRRTPGLRREEVATLAGVSIDYLVRLEQGRDTNPSPSVLAALADALRLNDSERLHLHHLVMAHKTPDLCPSTVESDVAVRDTVQDLLVRLDPTPAFVAGPYGDVLATNAAWRRLVEPTGLLDGSPPNLARHAFLHPAARDVYLVWDLAADDLVAQLRACSLRWSHDPAYTALIEELSGSADFASRWAAHDSEPRGRGEMRLVHPQLGTLRVAHESLGVDGEAEQRLVTWLPADEQTAAAFEIAAGSAPSSPARLRVVGD